MPSVNFSWKEGSLLQHGAAIHRHDQSSFGRIAFDWTCEWGANWLRPLELIALLTMICSAVYSVGLRFGQRSSLYLVRQRKRNDKRKEMSRRLRFRRPRPDSLADIRFGAAGMAMRTYRTALLFSIMSVVNIGCREFNFGQWIRMLQPREFDIRARGWMRTVSGIQSLLGLALIALSLLSYFGHPFD